MSQAPGFDSTSLVGPQIRAARALLGVSAQELAKLTDLGEATIRRAENAPGLVSMTAANARRLVEVLEGLGVLFLEADSLGGAGVRLKGGS